MKNATKATIAAHGVHHNTIKHCTENLRIKEKYPENQSAYCEEHTPEYFIGMADGMNHFLETILHQNDCYHGYRYVREDCKTAIQNLDDPEYKEWRRDYYIYR